MFAICLRTMTQSIRNRCHLSFILIFVEPNSVDNKVIGNIKFSSAILNLNDERSQSKIEGFPGVEAEENVLGFATRLQQ